MPSVGRYRLLETIGEGGMGVVYKALDPLLQRTIAIKLISTRLDELPDLRERFFVEARAAAHLSHRNIITIYDLGEENGHPYFAMEFLDGRNLRVRMQRPEGMSLERKLDIVSQLCEGLAYAHGRGIVHRDVKPANVFITDSGQLKILDFGLARLPSSDLTRSMTVLGTFDYMAPEQISGEKVDHRTDIFSVGVVLYELLAARRPFRADSVASMLNKILKEVPEPLSRIDPSIPPSLSAIVDRALAKTTEERYQSLNEMLVDLADCRGEMRGTPHPDEAQRVLSTISTPGATRATRRGFPRRWIVDVVALAAVAAGGWLLAANRAQLPQRPPERSVAAAPADRAPSAPPQAPQPAPPPPPAPDTMGTIGHEPGRDEVRAGREEGGAGRTPAPGRRAAASALADVRTAQAEAEEAGARDLAPQAWAAAGDAERAARRAYDGRQFAIAAGGLTDAATLFRTAARQARDEQARRTEQQTRAAALRDRAAAARNAYDQAKARAEQAGAPGGAPSAFREAVQRGAEAQASLDHGDLAAAIAGFNGGSALLEDAQRAAQAAASRNAAHAAEAATPAGAATARPAAPLEAPPERAIQEALGRYVAAFESRDLSLLKQVWPDLGGAQERAIREEFGHARAIAVRLVDPRIAANGSTASVSCRRRYQIETEDGHRLQTDTPMTLTLHKAGSSWVIQSVHYDAAR